VNFKALRNLSQKTFEAHGSLRILPRVILGYGSLKLAIQAPTIRTLALITAGCCHRQACQERQQDKPQYPVSDDHGSYVSTAPRQVGTKG